MTLPYAPTAMLALQVTARTALAALFVWSGIGKAMDLSGVTGALASLGLPLPNVLGALVAGFEIVAGIALIIGWQARWMAAALALFTALATLLFHAFWTFEDAARGAQLMQFMKNLSIFGGLVMTATTPQLPLWPRAAANAAGVASGEQRR